MRKRPWEVRARVTPEGVFWRRREVLRALGFMGMASLLGAPGCGEGGPPGMPGPGESRPGRNPFPAARNARYAAGRPLTPEDVSSRFNNFYEFTEDKEKVHELVDRFRVHPWTVRVDGLVEKPRAFDLDDLLALPHEERIYRFRCVEAWAMTVPWSGVPLARVLAACRPLATAKFVRFVSFHAPDQAPNQVSRMRYPWPYFEGLRLDEAMHELTLLATGIYGHPLPKQHGAPVRIVTPWKYGYKSPKSVVQIELVAEQPRTFWNDLEPVEYSFLSNVDPAVPHPRWSQATERIIGSGERVDTLPFNGYGDLVGGLYRA